MRPVAPSGSVSSEVDGDQTLVVTYSAQRSERLTDFSVREQRSPGAIQQGLEGERLNDR